MARIRRALISVYDKSGLIPFVKVLAGAGVELLSTGGTAKAIRCAGMEVKDISDLTGFPEILDGRVKTLHPKVHGGLLYLRDNPEHAATAEEHGILPIDLVVVNLYPFEQTISRPKVTLAEAIENIDIGGPAMLRSAAKNHDSVTVVMDPNDYPEVSRQIQSGGETSREFRRTLAMRVFARTSAYDATIAAYMVRVFGPAAGSGSEATGSRRKEVTDQLPDYLSVNAPRVQALRYGENPHQQAALYGGFRNHFQQLHGKELSYNNILDLTAAARLIGEFAGGCPTLAILKHTNPCGVGQGSRLAEAWENAFATDQQAPFGGIIAVNQPLDGETAKLISEIFSEVIVAPDFEGEAMDILTKKKNLRLIRQLPVQNGPAPWELRSVGADSFLLQQQDRAAFGAEDIKVVSRRKPSEDELGAMLFGWRIVKHVKSNAILYVAKNRTLGIGAGQMSRVDASRIAVWKAGEAKLSLAGSAVCSDAFFPFPDGLVAAAEAGATAAIQPGGSVRDDQVIAAADERDMAMVFTGMRHFRH